MEETVQQETTNAQTHALFDEKPGMLSSFIFFKCCCGWCSGREPPCIVCIQQQPPAASNDFRQCGCDYFG